MLIPLGWLLCAAGLVTIVIAAAGVLRLPDALARQHAATKAGTVAVVLFAIGTALLIQDFAWTWRLIVIVGLLLATLPLASHALTRTAAHESVRQMSEPSQEKM
jgi:multicomponent Na+:H+ antiporter subunit G